MNVSPIAYKDFISLVNSAPGPLRMELISRGITGLRRRGRGGAEIVQSADTELTQRLNEFPHRPPAIRSTTSYRGAAIRRAPIGACTRCW